MTDLTREELDRLERLAEAATKGPWGADGRNVMSLAVVNPGGGYFRPPVAFCMIDAQLGVSRDIAWSNTNFIAAANPETIKRLVAMARRAETEGLTT